MTGEPTTPAPREPSSRIAVGGVVGSYVIESLLGRGGMAVVFVARHRELDKRVAIKVLKPELAENEEIRKRFMREGRAASRVHHPHVVDITDVGSDGNDVYLVMELLEGETLAAVLEREVILSPERVVDYLVPVVAALGAAHKRGVVHRDLKPENIFLARDPGGRAFPKVLDFGISHITEGVGEDRVTELGSVLGTPHYMSPEQARGDVELSASTDQFSLAIILYEALVGRLPYEGETAVQLIHEVARGEVRPLRAFKSWIPEDLESVVMRALANEPSERYATIEELGLALLPFGSERSADLWRPALMGQTKSISLPPPPGTGPLSTGRRKRAEISTTPHRRSGNIAGAPAESADDGAWVAPALAPPVTGANAAPARPRRTLVAIVGLVAVAILIAVGYALTTSGRTTTATLRVDPGGTVELDGVRVGAGTLVAFSFPDDGASHHLVVRAEGRRDFEGTLTSVDQIPERIVLEPIVPAVIAVDAGAPALPDAATQGETTVAAPPPSAPPTTTGRIRPRGARPHDVTAPPPTSGRDDDLRIER